MRQYESYIQIIIIIIIIKKKIKMKMKKKSREGRERESVRERERYKLNSLFPIMEHGSRPWTLSYFRAHHTHSPRMVNSTSQFSCTRLDEMLHAYECNHANSYIQFSWFIRNYISNNSNNHINTSI